jgi:ribose-phosphate pyrophosphokinase
MTPVVFAFPGNEPLAQAIAKTIGGETGTLILHRFPDGESYVRLDTPVAQRQAILVCGLQNPDASLLPLLFAADAARDLGATEIGIVAPYLAYLRQDTRFKAGEAVSSTTVGRIVSSVADWIVTVDPHLHRYASLSAVYSIRASVVRAAPLIAEWVKHEVAKPLLIGPDSESASWVSEVAAQADAPYLVLQKSRHGDREVSVSAPELAHWHAHTPVLVDDIISTGQTMIETAAQLRRNGLRAPVCVGVHAIFAGDAYAALQAAGVAGIVTCNTIAHPSNVIDVNGAICSAVAALTSMPAA